jgi:methionyl-tRNA synthetase
MLRGLGIQEPITSIRLEEAFSPPQYLGSRQWQVGEVEPLFPRIEAAAAKPVPVKTEPTAAQEPVADQIAIEEFRRIDLRVAEVIEAAAIPGSKKLVRLRVRLQDEERTVVAGLKEHYPPETWAGKRIILVANLKPTKLMGIVSQGMVLAAEDESGRIVLLTPEAPVASGAKVR